MIITFALGVAGAGRGGGGGNCLNRDAISPGSSDKKGDANWKEGAN